MLNIGPFELMIILIVALIVVGPKRLPEVGRSIGRGLREFRKAQDEVRQTLQGALGEPATGRPAARAPAHGSSEGALTPASEPEPAASEGEESTEAMELARTIGQGLGELRKVREEVTRTFRVDPGSPRSPAPRSPGARPAAPPDPAPADPDGPGTG